ncbi:MAG: hypothetical protein E7588_01925 [Ruminococcaceae bacterium]|nr:hypothetical protein [Oscillospiraceae bacterium]
MQKTNLSIIVIILLFVATIACSLLSGVFILPAIISFSALCVGFPSYFLPIAPIISIVATFFINRSGDTEVLIFTCATSIFYVLPSVLIAWGYFKKQTKAMIVINGAIGIFLYTCILALIGILLTQGAFTPQILNSVIDAQLPAFTEYMTAQLSLMQAGDFSVDHELIEEVFFLSKPLLPAAMATVAVIASYIAICVLNLILKKTKIIENSTYRVVLHWGLGIFFILCTFFGTFGSLKSYLSILIASFTMVLTPLFFVIGSGVVFDSLSRFFKNRSGLFLLIVFIIIFFVIGTVISNLFYLIGAYYCIVNGIKNRKINRFKGGKQ